MPLVIDKVRRLEKASSIAGELPTIAPNNDHTTGWADTDIYERELFANLPDGKLYTREGGEIVEFNVSDLQHGVYFYRITLDGESETYSVTRNMIVIR